MQTARLIVQEILLKSVGNSLIDLQTELNYGLLLDRVRCVH